MHRGCFVWTPTPPLSGRRTPRPGPARVCLCVLFLAGSGGPASRARFGRLTFPLAAWSFFFVRPPPGWGCPCCLLFFSLSFFLSSLAPPLSPAFCASQPRVHCALALFVCSCPPPFFFFPFVRFSCPLALFPLCSRCLFPALSAPGLGFARFPPPPPPLFCFFVFFCLFSSLLRSGALSCVVPSRIVVWCVVLCVVLVPVSPGRRARRVVWGFPVLPSPPPPVLLPPVAVAWSPCRGPLLCSVLGCGAVLFCCSACRVVCCCLRRFVLVVPRCFVCAGWCRVLLPVVAGCSLLGLAALCCFLLACFVAGALAWPRGLLPCCVLWFVVAPRPPVLCPAFCGVVLPCGAALWCPAVRFALLVVLVCVLSLRLRCCVPLCAVLFGAGLVCAVVGASCCGVSLCVVLSPLAFCGVVVLPCCVVWCVVVSCCAVLCSLVPCCLVVPCCWAVLCVLLCCGCSCLLSVACIGPGVLAWPLAARPVVWCAGAASCGVRRPVLCPVVLRCLVVL